MKDLLEKLDWIFAGHKVGQKDGDQVRGTEKAKKKKRKTPYQEHPFKGRLVGSGGAAEEMEETVEQLAEQLRKELSEYGAPGSGIDTGTSGSREEVAQMRQQQKAQADQTDAQEDGIESQIAGLRAQMTAIKKSPEPIPNPADPQSIMQTAAAKAQKREEVKGVAQQIRQLAQQLGQMR